MSDKEHPEQAEGLKLGDVYFILFRQKWIILFFIAVGILAAAALVLANPPLYQSEAKLFIRYVLTGKSLNAPGSEQNARPLNDQEEAIINTEIEILKSFDLARQVADAIGPERILAKAGGGTNRDLAAMMVSKNLIVDPTAAKGSVIPIIFQHPDSQMAQEVLCKVIPIYYKKHADAHQPVAVLGDFMTQETKRLRAQLAVTDRQLKQANDKAGVTSLIDAKKNYAEQSSRIRMGLFDAEADLAGHQAMLDQAASIASAPAAPETTNTGPQVPVDRFVEYRNICARLDRFSKREQELELTFRDNSILVTEVREQIAEVEKSKKKLEEAYPQLPGLMISSAGVAGQPTATLYGLPNESIQIGGINKRIEKLKSQLREVQADSAKLGEMEATILDLQRKKELEEADLKYFSAKLEQGSIDERLGTGQAPNIGEIDPPTPPKKAWPKTFKKKLAIVGLAPIVCGFALAFLIELFLDTSVKRPSEVEKKLGLPLFISIPDMKKNGRLRFAKATRNDPSGSRETTHDSGKDQLAINGALEVAPWEATHPLRDRLIVYFEVRNLLHKPKLMAVTSCGEGAGVTSLAAGLAAALSETGDGKVLFVDMNPEQQGAAQMFYKGKPACGLEDALEGETKENALVHANFYTAAELDANAKLPRVLPKRFTQLMPKFRASDYEYIIFDMPPISQTSVTPRLAGLMDMVLLVVESEKTSREVVHQANALLAASKATVGVVLNKTHTYVPARLHQELLDET